MKFQSLLEAAQEHVRPLVGRGGSLTSNRAKAMIVDFLAGAAVVIASVPALEGDDQDAHDQHIVLKDIADYISSLNIN